MLILRGGGGGAETVILNGPEALCAGVPESVTLTVKLDVPALVGVPVIWPLEESVRPAGRLPAATLQLYGAVPPIALSAVE